MGAYNGSILHVSYQNTATTPKYASILKFD